MTVARVHGIMVRMQNPYLEKVNVVSRISILHIEKGRRKSSSLLSILESDNPILPFSYETILILR
jgi:hypothetical protein